jgi:asparaginyl-tRNA synthetase
MDAASLIADVAGLVGETVRLEGWVAGHRSSGKISFVELRDGSGFIQCVALHKQLSDDDVRTVSELTLESAVSVRGVVSAHPKREGEYELQLEHIEVLSRAEEYPISKKEHGPDFLLEHRHLWLRSKSQWAVQRIRDAVIRATFDFLHERHFVKIDSPILTSVACEGTTTLFGLDYFGTQAYLSQSGQLYLEAAIMAHGRVFDFGPVFRAEKSKTRKHLIEFWMMDAEMAFCDHAQSMQLQEELICHIVQHVLREHRADLAILRRDVEKLEAVQPPFPRVTHKEVVAVLRELGSEITEEADLGAADETLLEEVYDRPLFIERWPAEIKAFYMKRSPEDPGLVLASDLMAPEGFGELIGGSQREDDLDLLLDRMTREGLPVDEFQWYLDTRRYGSVPHSGFGFGLERLVAWISGVRHIRETIPFPRLLNRIKP